MRSLLILLALSAALATPAAAPLDAMAPVTLPGGPLTIAWQDDDHIMMTGAIEDEFAGTIDRETLAWTRTDRGAA